MTATTSPQPQASIAFDIPVPKKDGGSSPRIQMKLEARANSPRKEVTLADVKEKLDSANQKKKNLAGQHVAKAISHNASVKKVAEESVKREVEELEKREKQIALKQSKAEANRDEAQQSFAQRLSAMARARMQRSAKVKEGEYSSEPISYRSGHIA